MQKDNPFGNVPPNVQAALEAMLGGGGPPRRLESVEDCDFMGDAMVECANHYARLNPLQNQQMTSRCQMTSEQWSRFKERMLHPIVAKITSKRNVEWLREQFLTTTHEEFANRPTGEQIFFVSFADQVDENIAIDKLLNWTLEDARKQSISNEKAASVLAQWKETKVDFSDIRAVGRIMVVVGTAVKRFHKHPNIIEICEYIIPHLARGKNFVTGFPTQEEELIVMGLVGYCMELSELP